MDFHENVLATIRCPTITWCDPFIHEKQPSTTILRFFTEKLNEQGMFLV